jgi:hypothetical protein
MPRARIDMLWIVGTTLFVCAIVKVMEALLR